MIPLLTREAVRALDRDAVERLGIPGLLLMENAGRGAFAQIQTRFPDSLNRVVVVGGRGQNGGDAWVVARHLVCAGHEPRLFLVGERDKVLGDAAVNLAGLSAMGLEPLQVGRDGLPALEQALAEASLVVDGLFGTGLDRPVAGLYADAIEAINAGPAAVVSLDLPSGLDADRGGVLGTAVEADLTVTFAAHKQGLHQHPGTALCGELCCVSIGVPGPKTSPLGLLERRDVLQALSKRRADAHKGDGGHVAVFAGSPGRTGAALLAGLGALRAGAGLCTLAPRAGARGVLDAKVVELMTAELPAEPEAALQEALSLCDGKQAAVVGPGFGTDAPGKQLAQQLAEQLPLPSVIDADALTALGSDLQRLRAAAAPRILTPHPGEAGRLLGISSADVQAERYAVAAKLAEDSGQVAVLKGARTVVAAPDGRGRGCPFGTPALGVAGTGDVLSGVRGALAVQLPAFEAACAGVALHALAGELAADADRGLLASEVARSLPQALAACRRTQER